MIWDILSNWHGEHMSYPQPLNTFYCKIYILILDQGSPTFSSPKSLFNSKLIPRSTTLIYFQKDQQWRLSIPALDSQTERDHCWRLNWGKFTLFLQLEPTTVSSLHHLDSWCYSLSFICTALYLWLLLKVFFQEFYSPNAKKPQNISYHFATTYLRLFNTFLMLLELKMYNQTIALIPIAQSFQDFRHSVHISLFL